MDRKLKNSAQARPTDLRGWLAVTLTIEEAAVAVLSDGAARYRREGLIEAAEEVEAIIRHHRISLLKSKAILSAGGIAV